jgi:hypothetical protein
MHTFCCCWKFSCLQYATSPTKHTYIYVYCKHTFSMCFEQIQGRWTPVSVYSLGWDVLTFSSAFPDGNSLKSPKCSAVFILAQPKQNIAKLRTQGPRVSIDTAFSAIIQLFWSYTISRHNNECIMYTQNPIRAQTCMPECHFLSY